MRFVPVLVALALLDGCGAESGCDEADCELPSSSTDAAPGCVTDYDAYPGASDTVSFRSDVLPIFGLGCTQSACHDSDDPRADLYLGPRCRFDEALGCVFNDPERPETALTNDDVRRVHEELVGTPSTTAPEVARATEGDPEASFIVHKLAGTHADRGYACTAQDSNTTGCGAAAIPCLPASALATVPLVWSATTWSCGGCCRARRTTDRPRGSAARFARRPSVR